MCIRDRLPGARGRTGGGRACGGRRRAGCIGRICAECARHGRGAVRNAMEIITVKQLNAYIKSLIEGDALLYNVTVKGEISNFTNHYKSCLLYTSHAVKSETCRDRLCALVPGQTFTVFSSLSSTPLTPDTVISEAMSTRTISSVGLCRVSVTSTLPVW